MLNIVMSETVLIPGGEFLMGVIDSSGDNPSHKVYLTSFYLDKYEVTNSQYHRFCKETRRQLPEFWGQDEYHCSEKYPNHPVVGVSWEDAKAIAEWCGMRLPTEAEWEYAARGGPINQDYPWGNSMDESLANYYRPEVKGTTEIGSFTADKYGLFDMVSNVAEWESDFYDLYYYMKSPFEDPRGPMSGKFRVIRGGG
jgi:sulfatase modifying factor 1